jgi:hypothetical protein
MGECMEVSMRRYLMISIPCVVMSCSKDSNNATETAGDKPVAATAAKVTEGGGAAPTNVPPEFATWDLVARAKAWQGARLVDPSLGSKLAIEVAGTAAKTWDGTQEKTLEFSLESPCSAKLSEKKNGSSSSTIYHFTIKDGQLLDVSDAGSRRGKAAIACVSNTILTLDASGACLSWDSMFDKWKSSPAHCGFEQKDGKEVFVAKQINGMDYTLIEDGDALVSAPTTPSKSYPDLAAAKAARDKK